MTDGNHITGAIDEITAALPAGVRLVAVSKYHPEAAIRAAYGAGQRVFGESHVQELCRKRESLPSDIQWHFIGHLQTNKVKAIVPFVALIHAVDSLHLLKEIHKQAFRIGRTADCLLQVRVAQEETKYGFLPDECLKFAQQGEWRQYPNARICGLMCMASNTEDMGQVRGEFRQAKQLFDAMKDGPFAGTAWFRERSWGMSGDYPVALEEGSTLIRVGTKIFGPRAY